MEFQQKSPAYRLLVIGANGGIGRQCIEIALKAGHKVTAVLRNPANLTLAHHNLKVVQGDIMHPETFEKYLANTNAVISAIGVKGGLLSDKPITLYSQGNANLLAAMSKMGVSRVFFISASAIEISPVLPFFIRLVAKYIVQNLLRNMYDDLREMEKLVKESGSTWTIVRPPQLNDKPVTGNYRFAINNFLKNCLSISRADVAHFIINNISNEEIYKTTIEIGY